jgi:hypothetical protein
MGVNVFQGVKTCVIVQLKDKNAPLLIGVHCMDHHTNLIVQIIFELGIVGKLRMCYKTYMLISLIVQRELKSLLNWLTLRK